jgi:ubiquinone/menaquinone biosynthesis C-methylase UbiE
MTTDYNPIAEQYKRCKQQPWRTHIESFTLMELLGDVKGLAAIDLACGEGFYTRMVRHRGATRVTGVDLSQGMIDLARKQEAQSPQGIEYVLADARDLPRTGAYDLALAAYLLNYAQDRAELQAMCDGIAGSLRPGGRFVTVNSSPALHFPSAPSYRKYGFETIANGEWQEGAPITWRFHLDDGAFDIENYFLSVATHEAALRQSGFQTVRWHPPKLSPDGLKEYDQQHWSSFLEQPPVTFIECVK